MDISILYEDSEVVAVDKPSGVMVHADGHEKGETVVDWFADRFPEVKDVGEIQTLKDGSPVDRSGVVHRLDRETSGVLLLAKSQEAFTMLKTQFQERAIEKEYRAFVYGAMKEGWGTVDRSIGRSTKDFRLRSAQRGAKGLLRPAVTDWERIVQNEAYAYLRLLPKTGRTHQLRVHLKAIGRPIVNDRLYAPTHLLESDNLGIERLALHAHRIVFEARDGERREVIAPVPESFQMAEARIAG